MVESDTGGRTDTASVHESPDHISITKASEMALRTARASSTRRKLFFDVLNESEDEDSYTIVISFRPGEEFEGTFGQERFKSSKTGRFEEREVLSHPKQARRFRIKRKTVVLGVIGISVLIGFAVLIIALAKGNRCPAIDCQKVPVQFPTQTSMLLMTPAAIHASNPTSTRLSSPLFNNSR